MVIESDFFSFIDVRRFERADSDVLNYLLEFVNWTTLPKSLRLILERRREEQTWKPWPHFGITTELTKQSFLILCCAISKFFFLLSVDTIASLSHICRLQIRLMLGPDLLMRTSIVQQLPVPPLLQRFLQFRDIQEPSYRNSSLFNQIQGHNNTHQHRHVL